MDRLDTFGLMLLGVSAAKLTTMYMIRRERPANAKQVGKVSELWIFPIKACRGVRVKEVQCTQAGVKVGEFRDRHWMICTKEDGNNFITQRQHPQLSLISPSFHGDKMQLDAPGMPSIQVPVEPDQKMKTKGKCWGDEVDVLDCGDKVGQWLTKVLQIPGCRLMYLHPSFKKRDTAKGSKKLKELARPGDPVALVDYAAYHITTEPSLVDLNNRLSKPVPMETFRSNIVADGCSAFDEDKWKFVYINNVKLMQLKLCQRCGVTTVDIEKGVKDPELTTLKKLREFRNIQPERYGTSPIMGTHLTLDNEGIVKVGDIIYATS